MYHEYHSIFYKMYQEYHSIFYKMYQEYHSIFYKMYHEYHSIFYKMYQEYHSIFYKMYQVRSRFESPVKFNFISTFNSVSGSLIMHLRHRLNNPINFVGLSDVSGC
jgi:hypothetical protein